MITIAQGDEVEIAGVGARHEHRQIGRFRAGVDEIADLQLARHFGGELGGVFGDIGVQINGGRMLQQFVLPPRRLDHVRMAMAHADGDNAAQRIQITAAFVVKEVLGFAFHQHHRFLVIEEQAGTEELAAQLQDLVKGRAGVGFGLIIKGGQHWIIHSCYSSSGGMDWRVGALVMPEALSLAFSLVSFSASFLAALARSAASLSIWASMAL